MSQWIWKFGEFEIYHHMLVHSRRQQYGDPEPAVWKLYAPDPVVCFRKTVTTQGGKFRILSCGDSSVTIGNDPRTMKKYGGKKEIYLEPGTFQVSIRVGNYSSFPCIYVDGVIESDETWEADDMTCSWAPVGTYAGYTDPTCSPEIFPFHYEKISWKKKEYLDQGVLFDFGKETFARIRVTDLLEKKVRIRLGESREEAMDPQWSVVRFEKYPRNGSLMLEPCAFRFIFISDTHARLDAEYEFLPVQKKGEFHCEEEVVQQVWDTAAYTFHLNCREFFLDGIKRDRWVWAADAYQSLFVNHYLFLDPDIEKRTLIALGGKSPFRRHINTIMDYSFFWIISIYEYYRTYGDKGFLHQILPQVREVMEFCENRTDEDGFIREKPGDWIFIDWAPMDKTGALCAEQILYGKAMECYAAICRILGMEANDWEERAEGLQKKIFDKFYDREKRVFIDSFESGRKFVTRQSNILAYLFLHCSAEQRTDIYRNVILNEKIPQITTPYFKFYENQVHCLEGNDGLLEDSIRNYYGSMLASGATTLYEEYDPSMRGAEHYAMYGNPYEKSLCHAWSASPIYLLGCFRLGVRNTGVAYDTFEVRPRIGDLRGFSGIVPVPGGRVSVKVTPSQVQVLSTAPGGTLYVKNKQIVLEPGKQVTVEIKTDKEEVYCERK